MSIKVRYFASIKEMTGRSEDQLTYRNSMSVCDVWQLANIDKPLPANMLAAINMEYVQIDCLVNDGDEVAFFPPVTGG